jgi:hypothetical protein
LPRRDVRWIIDNRRVASDHGHIADDGDAFAARRVSYATAAAQLGPQIEYFLPTAPSDTVRLEILDATGKSVASYKSGVAVAPAGGRGGRGGGGDPDDPDAAMMEGRFGRGAGAAPTNVITKNVGLNRVVWGVTNAAGLGMPPVSYQAKLTVGSTSQTVPFTVLIDPRLAAEGFTVADLKEQFDHNTKMRTLVADAPQCMRAWGNRWRATGAAADTLSKVKAVSEKLNTQPVRYGKPGLQAHITYLSGMTARGDQKVGRDALERYQVLRKELDAAIMELNKALGVGKIQ